MATSIVLDTNGYEHISYSEYNTSAVNYASYNGTAWTIQTIGTDHGQNSSIALDSDGYAHISYEDDTNSILKVASYNGTGWNVMTVGTDSPTGVANSIYVDTSGGIHVGYSGNSQVKYAYYNGSSWTIQNVDAGSNVGTFTSMVFDSNGRPYIAYNEFVGPTLTNIKVAYFNGSGWETEIVASLTGVLTVGDSPTDRALAIYNDYLYLSFGNEARDLVLYTNAPQGLVSEPSTNILGIMIFILIGLTLIKKSKVVGPLRFRS